MSKNSESSFIMGTMPDCMHFSGPFVTKTLFPERGSWFLNSGASVPIVRTISLFFNGQMPVSGGMIICGVR